MRGLVSAWLFLRLGKKTAAIRVCAVLMDNYRSYVTDGLGEDMEEVKTGLQKAAARMRDVELPEAVIKNFERLFSDILHGKTGIITEEEIEPVTDVTAFEDIAGCDETVSHGQELLRSLAVIRLNGGLGTTMGLDRAKSLLAVKEGLSFNDIIARQILDLRKRFNVEIPLVHMTSFSTDRDVCEAMAAYPELSPDDLPVSFLQHRHPKIYADTMTPANEADDELNWNPPGHGDIYAALLASGLAQKLLDSGRRYVFVANADNLGATIEPAILGFFAKSGAPFLMETAERTAADAKGGHLARRRDSGRLVLRESSQAPTLPEGGVIPDFRDITKYRHFNTNNIWLDLQAVADEASKHDGSIPLPLIANKKTVNPRDRLSRKVIQIESAMGAAIEVFEGSVALQVPRARFAPVKSNNDLLVVRSDVYRLGSDFRLEVNPDRTCAGLPLVSLENKYFGLISDFEQRMQVIPSLLHAVSLSVEGDVSFVRPLEIRGRVSVVAGSEVATTIPESQEQIVDTEVVLSEL